MCKQTAHPGVFLAIGSDDGIGPIGCRRIQGWILDEEFLALLAVSVDVFPCSGGVVDQCIRCNPDDTAILIL